MIDDAPPAKKQKLNNNNNNSVEMIESQNSEGSIHSENFIEKWMEDEEHRQERLMLEHLFNDDGQIFVTNFQHKYKISPSEWNEKWQPALDKLVNLKWVTCMDDYKNQYTLTIQGQQIGDILSEKLANDKDDEWTVEQYREEFQTFLNNFNWSQHRHWKSVDALALMLYRIIGDGGCLHRGVSQGIFKEEEKHTQIKACAMQLFDQNDVIFRSVYDGYHMVGVEAMDWNDWKIANRAEYHCDHDGVIFFLAYMILFNAIIIVVDEKCNMIYPADARDKHAEVIHKMIHSGKYENQTIRLVHLSKCDHYDYVDILRILQNPQKFDLESCIV